MAGLEMWLCPRCHHFAPHTDGRCTREHVSWDGFTIEQCPCYNTRPNTQSLAKAAGWGQYIV